MTTAPPVIQQVPILPALPALPTQNTVQNTITKRSDKVTKTELAIMFNRNLCETKKEYTKMLVDIVVPFIYEGIASLYAYAKKVNDMYVIESQNDSKLVNPGTLKIFQVCVKDLGSLNNDVIEREYNRIKEGCKCGLWFDSLVKAVFKSNIALLSFTGIKCVSDTINENFHETLNIKDFVHKCYIESGRNIYECPELFSHELSNIEQKRNKREVYNIIDESIRDAIRKILPMERILKEYLTDNCHEYQDIPDTVNITDVNIRGGSRSSSSSSSSRSSEKEPSVNLLESDNSLYQKTTTAFNNESSSESETSQLNSEPDKLDEPKEQGGYQDQVNNIKPEPKPEPKSEPKPEPKVSDKKPGVIPRAESDTEFVKILKENNIDLEGMNKKRGRKPKSESKTYFEKFMHKP